jgi:hypothetical protein
VIVIEKSMQMAQLCKESIQQEFCFTMLYFRDFSGCGFLQASRRRELTALVPYGDVHSAAAGSKIESRICSFNTVHFAHSFTG